MRHHPRLDGNQVRIVEQLRAIGCTVLSLASIGKGCPDLLVARNNRNILMEIKDGKKPKSHRKLTDDEVSFAARWAAPVFVVYDANEAIDVMKGAT